MRKGDGARCARRCSVCSACCALAPGGARGDLCQRGGVNGTATLTFGAGGRHRHALAGRGRRARPMRSAPARAQPVRAPPRSRTRAQVNAVGSAAADTLVVDLTAGLFLRPGWRADGVAVDRSRAAATRSPCGSRMTTARCTGGTLGADLDGDAAPGSSPGARPSAWP